MKLLLTLVILVYGVIPGALFLAYQVPHELGVMIAWGIATLVSVGFIISRGDNLKL